MAEEKKIIRAVMYCRVGRKEQAEQLMEEPARAIKKLLDDPGDMGMAGLPRWRSIFSKRAGELD